MRLPPIGDYLRGVSDGRVESSRHDQDPASAFCISQRDTVTFRIKSILGYPAPLFGFVCDF
jgi:hypothetical protein